MSKADFVEKFKTVRSAFNNTLSGLTDAEASAVSAPESQWPTIKDMLGHLAAWEREVLIMDELIKRGEESNLAHLESADFNAAQATHRHNWPLSQLLTELDLNYEALLMAWDEYEDDEGPFGPTSWQPVPQSLWWLLTHQVELAQELARRRGITVSFPEV